MSKWAYVSLMFGNRLYLWGFNVLQTNDVFWNSMKSWGNNKDKRWKWDKDMTPQGDFGKVQAVFNFEF